MADDKKGKNEVGKIAYKKVTDWLALPFTSIACLENFLSLE